MRKTSRANFLYRIGEVEGQKVVLIWDQNTGNMSVTNDIENVAFDIAMHEGIDPTDYLIVYRNSEGSWDGWDAGTEEFIFLSERIIQSISGNLQFNLAAAKSL